MRYFAYVTNGKWNLNSLLSSSMINNTFRNLPLDWEAFASIQNYDAKGNILSCPLYIDVDSSSLYDAWESTQNTWANLKSDFNIDPYVYFSGSKGFHIIMPFLIKHSRCHEIAGSIAKDYCTDLDNAVYNKRRMWRCNGSINSKTGMYKIRVRDIHMPLDRVLKEAESGENERFKKVDFVYHQDNLFDTLVEDESKSLKNLEFLAPASSFSMDMDNLKPCFKALWDRGSSDITEGERHNILYLLARTTVAGGLSFEEARNVFLSHPFWGKHYPLNELNKVLSSTHRNNNRSWSCVKGKDSELLTPNCMGSSCFYHKDFIIGLNENTSCERMEGC